MKKVFFLSAAVLAMTACSNTDVLEEGALQQTNAIGFQSLVNKNSRALTNDNFTSFQVFGTYHKAGLDAKKVNVFNDVTVTKGTDKDGNTVWSYTTLRYWIKDAIYNFYAYSCENVPVLNTGDNIFGRANFGEDGILNIDSYICDNSHQHDLVFAKNADNSIVGQETGNAPVNFDFKHILAKLNVKFINEYPEEYVLEISNVRVNNIRNTGKFLGSTLEWTNVDRTASNKTVSLSLKDATVEGTITLENQKDSKEYATAITNWGYVLPFKYESKNIDIIFKLKVTNPLGDTVVETEIKGSWQPEWQKSTAYAYTITLTGGESGLEPIKFGVSDFGANDGWSTGTGSNITFDPATGGTN